MNKKVAFGPKPAKAPETAAAEAWVEQGGQKEGRAPLKVVSEATINIFEAARIFDIQRVVFANKQNESNSSKDSEAEITVFDMRLRDIESELKSTRKTLSLYE